MLRVRDPDSFAGRSASPGEVSSPLRTRAWSNSTMLNIYSYLRGPLGNNVYLLVDEATSRAAIVDPGIESEDILEVARTYGWGIELIINTHAHFDHVYNNAWYAAQTDAPIALHAADLPLLRNLQQTCLSWGIPVPEASPEPSIELQHRVPLDVFGTLLEVRHTPGHSPGQVCVFGVAETLVCQPSQAGVP
ncbi:MAG: MBL fold metallo-hydrolase, partial [bacterium]|nr:MBL fold metallo-hydrolase [bacterium]